MTPASRPERSRRADGAVLNPASPCRLGRSACCGSGGQTAGRDPREGGHQLEPAPELLALPIVVFERSADRFTVCVELEGDSRWWLAGAHRLLIVGVGVYVR
jgi:hypothetical protein